MSTMPSSMLVFECGLQPALPCAPAPTSGELDALIRQMLQESCHVAMTSPDQAPLVAPQNQGSASLLNGMGDYLVRTASVWARLTENFAAGDHIEQTVRDVHMRSQHDTHFADISGIAALDLSLAKLRRIQNLTAQYSRDVQAIWCPESQGTDPSMESQVPISPFYAMKPLSIQQSLLSRNGNKNRPGRSFAASSQQDPGLPNDDDSGSDGSDDDDDELFQGLNLDSLKSRGKGEHYCPKRFDCTKGGVDENGKLVAFVRNSAYLQHCNKHLKPWRCDKPYCPNPPKKRKFARRDGLERHQTSVSHKPPGAKSPKAQKIRKESG